MRKVKEGAYSDKDLARAVNFFLMDKLRKEETLAKDQVIKIKNICYRLGRNNVQVYGTSYPGRSKIRCIDTLLLFRGSGWAS